MKLLTEAIKGQLPALYSQEDNPDPQVVCKFFCPWNQWTWYVTEGQPEGDDFLFFGLVVGQDTELGYFTLNELAGVKHWSGLRTERDMHWQPVSLSAVKEGLR